MVLLRKAPLLAGVLQKQQQRRQNLRRHRQSCTSGTAILGGRDGFQAGRLPGSRRRPRMTAMTAEEAGWPEAGDAAARAQDLELVGLTGRCLQEEEMHSMQPGQQVWHGGAPTMRPRSYEYQPVGWQGLFCGANQFTEASRNTSRSVQLGPGAYGMPGPPGPMAGYAGGVDEALLRFYDNQVIRSQMQAGDAFHAPISGNLYCYMSLRNFGEQSGLFQVKDTEKDNPFLLLGLYLVIVLQAVGPVFVLIYALPKAFPNGSGRHGSLGTGFLGTGYDYPSLWLDNLVNHTGTDDYLKLVLGSLFIILFCLNGVYVLESDIAMSKRVIHLNQVFHAAAARSQSLVPPKEFWLYLGAVINCWCLILCAIAMWPCFIIAEDGPKDILFDALGLTFLYNLDDISGDLGFLTDQWDEDQLGDIYGELADEERGGLMEILKAQRQSSWTADNVYNVGIFIMKVLLVVLPCIFIFTIVLNKHALGSGASNRGPSSSAVILPSA